MQSHYVINVAKLIRGNPKDKPRTNQWQHLFATSDFSLTHEWQMAAAYAAIRAAFDAAEYEVTVSWIEVTDTSIDVNTIKPWSN